MSRSAGHSDRMTTAGAICTVNWSRGSRGKRGFGGARCIFTTKRDNSSSLQYHCRGIGYTNVNFKSCFCASPISIVRRRVVALLSPSWIQTKNFYVVRKGRIPGIYDNWEDCNSQDLCQASSQLEEPPVKTTKSKRTRKKLDETESNELEQPLAKASKLKRTRKKLDETDSNEESLIDSSLLNKPLGNSSKATRSRKPAGAADLNEVFYQLEFDGSSKGNPGKAGAGALLRNQDGKVVYKLREGVGFATCNVAEYRALILGLKVALSQGICQIHVKGDSKLVCMQVQGLWKIKSENMAKLCAEAKELKAKFKEFHIKHIYREFNSDADALANAAVNLQNGEWLASKVGLQDSSDASVVEPLENFAKSRSLKKIGVTDCNKDLFEVSEKSLEKISKSRKARKKLDATDSDENLFQVAEKPLEKISKSKKARKKLDAIVSDEDLFQVSEKPIEMITKSRKSRKKLVATDFDEVCYQLEFDGAYKGNPRRAGAGALLRNQDGKVVYKLREGVGFATNNVAQYRAVIMGMKVALSQRIFRIQVQGDSKLVCMQIQGLWKTKNENMAKLCAEANQLKTKFQKFYIRQVDKEFNSDADALANAAIKLQNGECLSSRVDANGHTA